MLPDDNQALTAEEIARAFRSGDSAVISETLVTLALADPDWRKVQTYCLHFLEHPDAGVRKVAATCIGHLARLHHQLDLDLVLPALYRHQSDTGKYVAGNVDNALSAIERFMQVPVKRDPAMRGDDMEDVGIEEEEEELPLTAEEVEGAFRSGDILEIEKTLVALAFRNADWRTTQAYCLEFLEHPNAGLRAVAADCFGYLATSHKQLDLDLALPALYRHRSDPDRAVVRSVDVALKTIAFQLQVPVQHVE